MERSYPDSIDIVPATHPVDGEIRVPGSKSLTNRALIVAALGHGKSLLSGALHSDDTRYMATALNELGIPVSADLENESFAVEGQGGAIPSDNADLFVGNSGTTMRFLTALLPLGNGNYRIDGIPRMRKRPIGTLVQALIDLGGTLRSEIEPGFPPVRVTANGLKGGTVLMEGNQSSQYFSALLLAAPQMSQGIKIEVAGDLVSKPYMTMTAKVMADFGVMVDLDTDDWRDFHVSAGQRYVGRDYIIEPDASNASYFFAAAAVTGGRVRINGLGSTSTQGDLQFVRALQAMGASVTIDNEYTEVHGPAAGQLKGVDLDFNAISDTAQTLAAIAPFASGPTTIRGIAHARLKETDRVSAVAAELRKLGQLVKEFPDGLTIDPRPVTPARVATYDDHRMAMSFAITGIASEGVSILDPGCVAKTFPGYFDLLQSLTQRN